MTKKILIAVSSVVILAILTGIWVSGEAAAKNPEIFKRFRRQVGALGQVTSSNSGQLVITRRSGEEVAYLLDENTKIKDRAGNELSSSELQPDSWVIVLSPRGEQIDQAARLVVVLPGDFDPENMVRARGMVAGIDEAASQVTLKTPLGEELVIQYGPETIFRGQASDISRLQVGMWARIFSQKLEKAAFWLTVRSTTRAYLIGEIRN
jgi:hypothetical protein